MRRLRPASASASDRATSRPPVPRTLAAAVALAAAAGVARAEVEGEGVVPDLVPPDRVEQEELLEAEETDLFALYAGLDFVSQYLARGLVYSNQVALQPWIEVDVPLAGAAGLGPFDGVSAFAGNWNSLDLDGPDDARVRTGRARSLRSWFEADVYGGVRVRFLERFAASLRFNFYTSPSGSWGDIHEVDWRLGYDDSALWTEQAGLEGFALYPSLRIAKETRDEGGPEGWYFEPALTPTYVLRGPLPVPVTVALPLALGLGADEQYVEPDGDERHVGFFRAGAGASAPFDLPFPGTLSVSGGVDVIVLGDHDLGFRGDGTEVVGKVGITYGY